MQNKHKPFIYYAKIALQQDHESLTVSTLNSVHNNVTILKIIIVPVTQFILIQS
uniref:Uncharacterized protein n=1 Tax=Setaria italica TaxID=4555 RepID=K3XTS4_SETIT